MTDWRAEADRLRAEGLTVTQIAVRLGKARSTIGDHLQGIRCECGTRRARHAARCLSCRRANRRWVHERRVELVAGMFADGWTYREIASVLEREPYYDGALGPEIADARARGLIDYRYSDFAARAAA